MFVLFPGVSPTSILRNTKGVDENESKNLKSGMRQGIKNGAEKNTTSTNSNVANNSTIASNSNPTLNMLFNKNAMNTKSNLNNNASNISNGNFQSQSAHDKLVGMETAISKIPKSAPFDYATLFLLKNSLNYIYDMYLTLNTFNCLRMSKINKRLTSLNFEYFVNYMINYFYPISKIKNFKIELESDLEGEVYAIYDYYRVIFFNVIIFILNNTRDSKNEKTLTISVKHHIFTENQGSYYKAIFSFTDESPYIPYNLLSEVLNSLRNTELNSITLEKYKLIDFGLIVSFYIANTVYNSEFNINTLPNTHNHMIIVNILASNTKESNMNVNNNTNMQGNMQLSQISMQNNTIRSIVATKVFKKPKTIIEEAYYNKILQKLYKENKSNGGLEVTLNSHVKNNNEKLKNTV